MASVNLSSVLGSPVDKPPTAIMGRNTRVSLSSALTNAVAGGLSGATTADTYKSLLALSAPGVLKLCAVRAIDATARTVSLRLTIDGVVAYEHSEAFSSTSNGLAAAGVPQSLDVNALERIPFNTLDVSIKSTITETDKIATYLVYDLV